MDYMLEGISRRHQGQRSAQRRVIYEVRWGYSGIYTARSWKSLRMEISLGNLVQCSWWKDFSLIQISAYVYYEFPRGWSEANQSVDLQIVLLALFEAGCNICFLPNSGNLSRSLWPFWVPPTHLCLLSLNHPHHSHQAHIFLAQPLILSVETEAQLTGWDIPSQSQLHLNFAFPDTVPTCPGNVFRLLHIVCHCFHLLSLS